MPRILPRLLKLPLSGNVPFPFPSSLRPKSLRKPVPALYSVLPADHPRSVLLSPGNVITNSHDYVHHKASAPIPYARRRRVSQRTGANKEARPREMSAQERVWWSSPYLRMLAGPLRQCYLTERYLPADFMIRLAAMRVPLHLQKKRKRATQILFPDGLQHPKFKERRNGHGTYIMCWRDALEILDRPMRFKRLGAAPPPRLGEYITHLLRLRVLQELHLLAKQLETLYLTRTGPASARPPLLRRLTRAEWGRLRTTGALPYPGALAVLVVPPVNRDPATKQLPPAKGVGAMSDRPPVEDGASRPPPKRAAPPLSVLHPVRVRTTPTPSAISETELPSDAEFWEQTRQRRAEAKDTRNASILQLLADAKNGDEGQGEDVRVPPHAEERVPLYNGVTLFPGRLQRARLHKLLTRILGVEGRWRFSAAAGASNEEPKISAEGKGDNKGSHAFLLCASDEVDVAALAIALWRMRMWEGGGWGMRSLYEAEEKEEEQWPWA
ncbi:hypothetical protein K438DRAFT_1928723 [Mycena galopus ATCC 62051]|nr:hypothetical protein K438DRAFT_1928723 [Mycena galopus ATCC 62051]